MEDNRKKVIVLTSMVYIATAYKHILNIIDKNDFDSLYEEISKLKDNLNDCFEIYNKLNIKAKAQEEEKC